MKAIKFEDLKVGETYAVVFLPGKKSEEYFKAKIKRVNHVVAVGIIDRRILLVSNGNEILKGQEIFLHKDKNHFYECN